MSARIVDTRVKIKIQCLWLFLDWINCLLLGKISEYTQINVANAQIIKHEILSWNVSLAILLALLVLLSANMLSIGKPGIYMKIYECEYDEWVPAID